MLKTERKNWINRFKKKLIMLYLLRVIIFSAALALLLVPIATYLLVNPILIYFTLFLFTLAGILILKPKWKITDEETAKYLNERFPELEESAGLFLKPKLELSLLEQFQVEKIGEVFPLSNPLKESLKKVGANVLLLITAVALAFMLDQYIVRHEFTTPQLIMNLHPAVKENIPAEIKNFSLKITPPAYTGNAIRSQRQFTFKAEIGALVLWNVEMNIPVKKLRIIFNDKEVVDLTNTGKLNWKFSKTISSAGFYQLEFDGKKSDLYQIEIIPDLPVNIKVIAPKPHTTIDFGALPQVSLNLALTDDYGISDAYISATMASGKGEGVSFTEKKLSFVNNFKNDKSAVLKKTFDLKALGMKPGDELYFFIQATDNHQQKSKSDVYLISIVDTAELMSTAGLASGIDLVPEYFRSQRQLIIDTEKLLKDQPTISVEEFKNKSNNLGMDQKLLRLRYGKFLGEESETEIGGGHDHDEGSKSAEHKFGDAQALMDEYAHKHDIAEDATFFEPELKKQLKAVLNEMWSAELSLRTYKPREALPFEYKALRLLKDLQQKSRAYVAKTTLKVTKLKMEKRLSGELDKVVESVHQENIEKKERLSDELRILLAILERKKEGKPFDYGERELLKIGEGQLILAAASQPNSYLPALKSLRKLSSNNQVQSVDMIIVQKAIHQLLGKETTKPQAKTVGPAVDLYRAYFNNLKN